MTRATRIALGLLVGLALVNPLQAAWALVGCLALYAIWSALRGANWGDL